MGDETGGEQRLRGGVMAGAVRVGRTVRRAGGPAGDTIQGFLRQLRGRGFTQAPEPLGWDERGREVFSYVEGRAGHPPITADIASDEALVNVARAIRRFHDASAGYRAEGWSADGADPTGPAEVICHNDLAPFNVVFSGRGVAAIIDWDGAAPGRRVWDLAYAVWRLVPLHRPEYTTPLGWPELDRTRRLALFADAYDMTAQDRRRLLAVVRERQTRTVEAMRRLADEGRIERLDPSDPRAEAGDLPYLEQHLADWHEAIAR